MNQIGDTLTHVLAIRAQDDHARPAQPDSKNWAREIVSAWDAGQYGWQHGYHLACDALGVLPKPRSKYKRSTTPVDPVARDVPGLDPTNSFPDAARPNQEWDSPESRFTHPHHAKDF